MKLVIAAPTSLFIARRRSVPCSAHAARPPLPCAQGHPEVPWITPGARHGRRNPWAASGPRSHLLRESPEKGPKASPKQAHLQPGRCPDPRGTAPTHLLSRLDDWLALLGPPDILVHGSWVEPLDEKGERIWLTQNIRLQIRGTHLVRCLQGSLMVPQTPLVTEKLWQHRGTLGAHRVEQGLDGQVGS